MLINTDSIDINSILTTTIPAVIGIFTGLWVFYRGIRDYREGIEIRRQANDIQKRDLKQKRKDIIFPLIEKFDDPKEKMNIAKQILDDKVINFKIYEFPINEIEKNQQTLKQFFKEKINYKWIDNAKFAIENDSYIKAIISNPDGSILSKTISLDTGGGFEFVENGSLAFPYVSKIMDNKVILYWCYHKSQLFQILRDHNERPIDDQGEETIRESFDFLLDFFGTLGYLLHIGLIEKDEILYFRYYINKIVNEETILRYCKIYHFELFALLLDKLNINTLNNILPKS